MRIFKWISCVCAILLCLSGCSLTPASLFNEAESHEYYDADKYSDIFCHNLQYSQLDEDSQHAYGQIYTALCDDINSEVVTKESGQEAPGIRISLNDVQLKSDEMAQLFEAFFHDNPQFFFWIAPTV